MEIQEIRQQAANLLMALWKGVPSDYKSRYRMTIWEQYENEVRSAAYTASLARFANSICLKLNAAVGKTPEEREAIERILNGGNDREILRCLREETTLVVLMVRVANQAAREEWQELNKE